jgi:IclR helix-turn-helix domain
VAGARACIYDHSLVTARASRKQRFYLSEEDAPDSQNVEHSSVCLISKLKAVHHRGTMSSPTDTNTPALIDAASDRSQSGASETITIELSAAQVDRVVRDAADGGNMSVLLSGLKDVRTVLAQEPRQLEDSRLSRSLLAGLLMLASFPTDGSYLGNAEIARMLDMNPSTTHRYVSTLVAVGLLERDPSTRRYRLV